MARNPKRPEGLIAPGTSVETVTPSDTVNLVTNSLGIYVGGAGDISVLMADGTTTGLFKAVPVGTFLPIQVQRINATNTTATLMLSIN